MINQDVRVEEEIPSELTPLREPTLFILLVLSKERMHGYAILKAVEALSAGRVFLSTGTLYGALARLLQQGVIRKTSAERGADGSRVRKYYELTKFGRRVLAAEIDRLGTILAIANRELGEEGI